MEAAKAPSSVVATSNSGLPTFDAEEETEEKGSGESGTGSDVEDEVVQLEW